MLHLAWCMIVCTRLLRLKHLFFNHLLGYVSSNWGVWAGTVYHAREICRLHPRTLNQINSIRGARKLKCRRYQYYLATSFPSLVFAKREAITNSSISNKNIQNIWHFITLFGVEAVCRYLLGVLCLPHRLLTTGCPLAVKCPWLPCQYPQDSIPYCLGTAISQLQNIRMKCSYPNYCCSSCISSLVL